MVAWRLWLWARPTTSSSCHHALVIAELSRLDATGIVEVSSAVSSMPWRLSYTAPSSSLREMEDTTRCCLLQRAMPIKAYVAGQERARHVRRRAVWCNPPLPPLEGPSHSGQRGVGCLLQRL